MMTTQDQRTNQDQPDLLVEISETVSKYNWRWDGKDAKAVAELFTEDGTFVDAEGTVYRGRAEIETYARSTFDVRTLRHLTTGHLAESSAPAQASHRCYLLFVAYPYEGDRVMVTGEYHDTLERTQAGWRFANRTVAVD